MANRPAPIFAKPRAAAVPGTEMPASVFEMTVIAFLIIVALYVGQAVLVPLALAVILSFVLAPPVRVLRRLGLSNSPSVLIVVAVAFAIIFGVGTLITQQVGSLVQELPSYQSTLREKVKSLKEAASDSSGALKQASDALRNLQDELDSPNTPKAAGAPGVTISPMQGELRSAERGPVPVIVRNPSSPLDQLQTIIGVVIHPLATAALVILFVMFLLLQREDVRDRAIRLLGSHDLEKSTNAMDDAGERLGSYFLALTAINTGYGIFIAFGLWMIGVPSPLLWGVLATLMRFVPFIGSFIAAVFPLILAAAVEPGWSMFLWTLGLYAVSEPVMGNVVEPVIQGQRTGLSPLAIILSAAFWTLLWGPIGLLMAIPLTVVLVVLGRHVERLEFLSVLLGDQPPLSPQQRFYQRMLAGDPAEAVEQAEKYMSEKSIVTYYDDVVIEGLRLAQNDYDRGTLDAERLADIRDTGDIVIETLADFDTPAKKAPPKKVGDEPVENTKEEDADDEFLALCAADGAAISPEWRAEGAVLCIAARTPLDETAGLALVQLLKKCGLGATLLDLDELRNGSMSHDVVSKARLICISSLDVRERSAHARFLVRRLKRPAPDALLLGCFWKLDPQQQENKQILERIAVDATASTMRDAVAFVIKSATLPNDALPEETTQPVLPAAVGAPA